MYKHRLGKNRYADIKSHRDGMVLYNALEDGRVIKRNVYRTVESFKKDYPTYV